VAPSAAAEAGLPTVTIEGRRALRHQVDHFVAAEVFQAPDESIMRWNEPICPSVVGLPRMFDDYIRAHIVEVARAANAPVGGQRCRANFLVIATYDPELVMKELRAKAPHTYDTRKGFGGAEGVPHSQRPVRVWLNSGLHCRIDTMSGGKSSDMMAFFLGGGGAQVDTSSPYFCGGGGSRLSYPAVDSIRSAIIVVDMNRMANVTTRQLADYLAMVGLADIRPNADAGAVPTILGLLQQPEHPPRGLSAWDRALLYSIYDTSQSSVLQASEMVTAVMNRITREGHPDHASFGSSTTATPRWADELLPRRDATAVDWYRTAAEQGDPDAQYALGVLYARGEGVPQDYREAARWYRKAADQGDAEAQYGLGNLYANGRGVARSYLTAAQWYREAAEQGNANAQSNLGVAYANGLGVPRNDAEAAEWFRRAAEQADADAQFNLAVMYYGGRGVPRNSMRAYEWWTLAEADASSKDIHDLSLHKLAWAASRMPPDQVARAHREASAWLRAHPTAR
jgi:TPR repeat protein